MSVRVRFRVEVKVRVRAGAGVKVVVRVRVRVGVRVGVRDVGGVGVDLIGTVCHPRKQHQNFPFSVYLFNTKILYCFFSSSLVGCMQARFVKARH